MSFRQEGIDETANYNNGLPTYSWKRPSSHHPFAAPSDILITFTCYAPGCAHAGLQWVPPHLFTLHFLALLETSLICISTCHAPGYTYAGLYEAHPSLPISLHTLFQHL